MVCLCISIRAISIVRTQISYVSRDMDSATYINMARSLHSKESMAYIMSVRYASLVEAYTAGMWYCFHRAANTSCATTEADVDQCFDQCSKLLTITRTVLFQLRRMVSQCFSQSLIGGWDCPPLEAVCPPFEAVCPPPFKQSTLVRMRAVSLDKGKAQGDK